MKCSNLVCSRGIGLVSYRRGRFSDGRYCSKQCRDSLVAGSFNLPQKRKSSTLRRFVVASVAFVGLIIPVTFTMAVLGGSPARQESSPLLGCGPALSYANAKAAGMAAWGKTPPRAASSHMGGACAVFFL